MFFAHLDAAHGPHSLLAGLGHPLLGLDHLLVLLAIGLWASQLGGRGRWLVPLSFAGAMLTGAIGGIALGGAALEPLIAASVILAGLLVASGVRATVGVAALAACALAAAHGHAHGAEIPVSEGVEAALFLVGMVLTSGAVMAAGLGAASVAGRQGKAWVVRASGLLVVAAGAMFVVGLGG